MTISVYRLLPIGKDGYFERWAVKGLSVYGKCGYRLNFTVSQEGLETSVTLYKCYLLSHRNKVG